MNKKNLNYELFILYIIKKITNLILVTIPSHSPSPPDVSMLMAKARLPDVSMLLAKARLPDVSRWIQSKHIYPS